MTTMSDEHERFAFPDLTPFLYGDLGTLAKVQEEYNKEVERAADELRSDELSPTYLDFYHRKLEIYRTKYYNFHSLSEFEQEVLELKQFLCKFDIPFRISVRLKNYIGFIEKVRTFIYDGLDPFSINDELGVRVIVGSNPHDNEASIKEVYDLANNVISFFVLKKGYVLVMPSPQNSLGFDPDKFPQLFVPKESLILPEYQLYVKDYFAQPKKRGYQALHIVLMNPQGLTVEIQVRSFASHYHAEFVATHQMHKDERYTNHPDLTDAEKEKLEVVNVHYDPEKVKLGSYYSKDGNTLDFTGLSEPIQDPFKNFFIS